MLVAENLHKTYRRHAVQVRVLNGLNLEVKTGNYTAKVTAGSITITAAQAIAIESKASIELNWSVAPLLAGGLLAKNEIAGFFRITYLQFCNRG